MCSVPEITGGYINAVIGHSLHLEIGKIISFIVN